MTRRRNWAPQTGALLGLVGVVSYFALVVFGNPAFTPFLDFPAVNLAVLGAGLGVSLVGVRRAYGRAAVYRGRVVAPVLVAVNLGFVALFAFFLFDHSAHLPEAANAPGVGVPAPDFALSDQRGNTVRLASLRGRNALLVFYRGHW